MQKKIEGEEEEEVQSNLHIYSANKPLRCHTQSSLQMTPTKTHEQKQHKNEFSEQCKFVLVYLKCKPYKWC